LQNLHILFLKQKAIPDQKSNATILASLAHRQSKQNSDERLISVRYGHKKSAKQDLALFLQNEYLRY
jgi:hypothetical protein